MKAFMILFLISAVTMVSRAQSILGSWQLVKETSCLEQEMKAEDDSVQNLVNDMKSMAPATPQVVQFKENNSGEESTQIIFKRKGSNTKNFMYKFDGTNLYILDKKSHTLSDSYTIDKLEGDSLIMSNSSRACETKYFVRIK